MLLDSNDESPIIRTSSLGDIMSTGLVTGPRQDNNELSLAERFGIDHPLNRMALTANGNLQRLLSSYYDAPVAVVVDSCVRRDKEESTITIYDRVVRLQVYDRTFCTASSVITVRDKLCQELVESGQVGLGQLFRFLDVLPEFTLLDAGPSKHGGDGFWRDYLLECSELTCRIHENFVPGMWQIKE
jgi:hypothetical protein